MVPSGARIRGSYEHGTFWYVATRPNGCTEKFLRRWQAVAYVNGWTPPSDLARFALPRRLVPGPVPGTEKTRL